MLIATETRLGIRITAIQLSIVCMIFLFFLVKSFVELVRFIFKIPGVETFLSERLTQDPLEQFFGMQRQRGGTSENPSVQAFCKNTQALRVVNSVCSGVSRGNCRGRKESQSQLAIEDKENEPLPKRKRSHK